MARIEVTINHRKYPIVCESGQEARVRELASFIDGKAQTIARAAPGSSDSVIMALTTLMVADELFEARRQLDEQPDDGDAGAGDAAAKVVPANDDATHAAAIEAVEYLTRRVAAIADNLQAH